MQNAIELEICCGSYRSAEAALEAGAQRVELCSGLSEGGLTPSIGLVKAVCGLKGIVHHVLIRPRGGDFLYGAKEKDIILSDIEACVSAGAEGVVVGGLTTDGEIDVPFLQECVHVAGAAHVTFHRAFDLCRDPFVALQQIADTGCTRLLTSGQAATAETGIPMLRRLVELTPAHLSIMPGCGVNAGNAAHILKSTGARNIHASARRSTPSLMTFRHQGVNMGTKGADEYATMETSVEEVRNILHSLSEVGQTFSQR